MGMLLTLVKITARHSYPQGLLIDIVHGGVGGAGTRRRLVMQRPIRCCMVRVQGGEAFLQAPAAHPIGGRLVSMKSSWGQGEQERSFAALEAAGFQGAGTPLRLCRSIRQYAGSMGFGESGSLPIGAERLDADFRATARGMQRESAAVSLAKMRVVLPRTSCGSR